jgi:predicted ATP-binding protein involved in virulence
MRIKQLKMQSFRGIGDLIIDFDEKEPIVFIGINGVGKSSILDCLAILLSNIIKEIVYPELEDSNQFSFRTPRLPTTRIIRSGYSEEKNYQKPISGKPEIENRFFDINDVKNGCKETNNIIDIIINSHELTFSLSSDQSNYQDKINKKTKNYFREIHNQLKYDSNLSIPLAVYYSVSRAVIDIDLEIIDISKYTQIDAYDEVLKGIKISFHRFFQWFRSLEDLENENRIDDAEYEDHQLAAVRKAIYSLIPNFNKLRIRRSPLRMTLQKDGEELIVNQLSDGEKCLLAMVGDLARRLAITNPGLENPLHGAGVVLIDEIELHLHPKWEREIIPALTRTFPNCQFIVTTHSPQVIGEVKPQGIYILEKIDTGVIAKHPESSYGRDSNQILEDSMDVTARPQEINDELLRLFRLIDAGNLEAAKQLREELAEKIGEDEAQFVKADILIRRKGMLRK